MIVCKSIGRLGRFANALFQIAGTIGVATKNYQPYGFPLFVNADHKERFGSNEDVEIYKHLANELPSIPEGIDFEYRWVNWGYEDIYLPQGNWDIAGHFQSWKYFDHCMDLVKHHLRLKDEYEQNDYISVHYRAGDYIDDQSAYHPRMPEIYYQRAVENFPVDAKFLLFSDDREEAIKRFEPTGRKFEVFEGKDYIDDFKMMKACKSFIICNSSYSAMAALLGEHPEKIVVSPSGYNWFGDVAQISGNDIMHPDWKQITFSKNQIAA